MNIAWHASKLYDLVHVLFFSGIANLNGISLYGKKLHVTNSKHAQVQMPQPGSKVGVALPFMTCIVVLL